MNRDLFRFAMPWWAFDDKHLLSFGWILNGTGDFLRDKFQVWWAFVR